MKQKNVSAWQPITSKPTLPGVYQIMTILGVRFSYFKSGNWHSFSSDLEIAKLHGSTGLVSGIQDRQWRGVLTQ